MADNTIDPTRAREQMDQLPRGMRRADEERCGRELGAAVGRIRRKREKGRLR